MTPALTRTALWRCAVAGTALLTLSACAMAPLGPFSQPAPGTTVAPAPAPQGDMDDITAAPLPDMATASGAEQACVAAGRERGLDVAGVVGSRAVGGNGTSAGRDVMLRVRRSGAEIEVRCNYIDDTGMARIMLI